MVNCVQYMRKQPIQFVTFVENLCTCYRQKESRRELRAPLVIAITHYLRLPGIIWDSWTKYQRIRNLLRLAKRKGTKGSSMSFRTIRTSKKFLCRTNNLIITTTRNNTFKYCTLGESRRVSVWVTFLWIPDWVLYVVVEFSHPLISCPFQRTSPKIVSRFFPY